MATRTLNHTPPVPVAEPDAKRARTDEGLDEPVPEPMATEPKPPGSHAVSRAASVGIDPLVPVLSPSVKYVTTDGDNIRALASVPCALGSEAAAKLGGKLDTLLVLDRSASMTEKPSNGGEGLTGEGAIREALLKLQDLVDQTSVEHHVAFAWFGSEAGVYTSDEITGYTPWMRLAEAQCALLNLSTSFKADQGATNVEAAIKTVEEMVRARRQDAERRAVMTNVVFITDGDATRGTEDIQSLTVPLKAAGDAVGDPIVISTIGVGVDVSWTSVQDLVDPSKGYFGYAPTVDLLAEEITNAFAPYKISCKPLCFGIVDADPSDAAVGGRSVTHGVLHPGNYQTVLDLTIGTKATPGVHPAAKVGLVWSDSGSLANLLLEFVAPHEMPDDNAPAHELVAYEAGCKFVSDIRALVEAGLRDSAARAAKDARSLLDNAVAGHPPNVPKWALEQGTFAVVDIERRAENDEQYRGGGGSYGSNASTMVALSTMSRSQSAY